MLQSAGETVRQLLSRSQSWVSEATASPHSSGVMSEGGMVGGDAGWSEVQEAIRWTESKLRSVLEGEGVVA